MKKGDKVRAKKHHAAMPKGTTGTVKSVHHGAFYGVAVGSGMAYMPAENAEPKDGTPSNPDPDNDGDNDMMSRWEQAMAKLIAAGRRSM